MNTIIKTKNVRIEGVGEVKYRHSKRARYIQIVIDHKLQLSVVIPDHHNIEDAIEFVKSKKRWIQKNKIKIANINVLKLELSRVELENFWNDTKQKMLLLSDIYQLNFYKLIFKTLKSRWGSCSQNNIICLNNILYYLPEYLQEYIMLHELVHTKIKNHSSVFWEELEKICPNSKLKRRELRNKYAIA